MHVIVATDGSRQSLAAAKHLKSFADPTKVTEISVVAVIRPLASVAFADDLSEETTWSDGSFRDAAESAVATIAAVFDGWGPKVNKRIRSGSAANEIIKAAKQYDAGLVVVAAGGRGLSDARARRQHRPARAALRALPGARRTPCTQAEEAPFLIVRVSAWRPCGWCCSSSTSSVTPPSSEASSCRCATTRRP